MPWVLQASLEASFQKLASAEEPSMDPNDTAKSYFSFWFIDLASPKMEACLTFAHLRVVFVRKATWEHKILPWSHKQFKVNPEIFFQKCNSDIIL